MLLLLTSTAALTSNSVALAATTQPLLSIPTNLAAPGQTFRTNVQFDPQGTAVAAIQFDLRYNRNVLTVTPTLGSAAIGAGKTFASAVLPNGDTRFIIFGFNQNTIGSGSIIDLSITVNAHAPTGIYALTFLNALGATPSGQGVAIGVQPGYVGNFAPR
jgi:hypothetical protein